MGLVIIFGILGYVMKKYEYPPAAMLLGLILGPLLEANAFRGLKIGLGSPSIFFTRPLAVLLWILLIITFVGPEIKRKLARNKEGKNSFRID